MTALTAPRWDSGTRSATTGVIAAVFPAPPIETTTQPRTIPVTESASAMIVEPAASTRMPPTNHGRRRPKRVRVRSESAPATGPMTSPTTAPAVATVPSTDTLSCGATSPTLYGRLKSAGIITVR